jgi:hypothetical protein
MGYCSSDAAQLQCANCSQIVVVLMRREVRRRKLYDIGYQLWFG